MELKKLFIKSFYVFIIFNLLFHSKKIVVYIESDNKISEYEDNIDFSNLNSTIKAIALYLPQFHETKENNKFWGKGFTEWTNVKKSKPRFKGHHQPRIPGDKNKYLGYYDLTEIKTIENQVKLAKNHGIYGFGIYYYWFSGKTVLIKPINLFLKLYYINFKFLLIWANENWSKRWDGRDKEILIKQEYKETDPYNFIISIKKYIIDNRYITINNKPIIGLYEPNKIPNLKETMRIWRKKSREIGIGEIFILICINKNKAQDFQDMNLFDASYEFPPRNSFQNDRILNKKTLIYTELLYKSRDFNYTNINLQKFPCFRGSMVEWDNCARVNNCEIFDYYSPEQFYMFNKIIIDWTIKHHYKNNRYIFINAWNEWGEGSYLEPDDRYGYSSINSLSKAIFNLPYSIKYHSIGENKIAIILHIYNEDSIKEIINKLNNIPYIYNLFIYIYNKINLDQLKQNINLNSNANYFELNSFLNLEGNILVSFFNFRKKAKNFKYVCNINTKKYKDIIYFEDWKNYIYNNLLGDSKIISEIISDFEDNNNLGIIFPEKYYKSLINFGDSINNSDLEYLNYIIKKIYPHTKVRQNLFDYPEGNMFWAKINAIYPIFNLYSNVIITNKSLLIITNNLEQIWIFLVKLNGFLYKKIFKHL